MLCHVDARYAKIVSSPSFLDYVRILKGRCTSHRAIRLFPFLIFFFLFNIPRDISQRRNPSVALASLFALSASEREKERAKRSGVLRFCVCVCVKQREKGNERRHEYADVGTRAGPSRTFKSRGGFPPSARRVKSRWSTRDFQFALRSHGVIVIYVSVTKSLTSCDAARCCCCTRNKISSASKHPFRSADATLSRIETETSLSARPI